MSPQPIDPRTAIRDLKYDAIGLASASTGSETAFDCQWRLARGPGDRGATLLAGHARPASRSGRGDRRRPRRSTAAALRSRRVGSTRSARQAADAPSAGALALGRQLHRRRRSRCAAGGIGQRPRPDAAQGLASTAGHVPGASMRCERTSASSTVVTSRVRTPGPGQPSRDPAQRHSTAPVPPKTTVLRDSTARANPDRRWTTGYTGVRPATRRCSRLRAEVLNYVTGSWIWAARAARAHIARGAVPGWS